MQSNDIDPTQAASVASEFIRATHSTTVPAAEPRSHPAPARPAAASDKSVPIDDPVVRSIRNDLTDPNLRVGFFMVDGSSQPVIRIYNRQTGEVVRQIPEEAVLHLRERFAEMLGVMADKQA